MMKRGVLNAPFLFFPLFPQPYLNKLAACALAGLSSLYALQANRVPPPYSEVDVQLTSFTDYGLRALIYMASLPEGRMTSISEVTEVYGVSRNHMVKIINQLSRAGYVTAVRGKNGGIRLGRPAPLIRIGDVVRELEPLSLVNCSSEFCHITPACRLKQALSKAVNSFLTELDNYTLADLVEENTPLYKLLLVE